MISLVFQMPINMMTIMGYFFPRMFETSKFKITPWFMVWSWLKLCMSAVSLLDYLITKSQQKLLSSMKPNL